MIFYVDFSKDFLRFLKVTIVTKKQYSLILICVLVTTG